MAIKSISGEEFSLAELLADPIVQVVMTRDGVTRAELQDLLGAVAKNLGSRASPVVHGHRREPRLDALAE